MAIDKIQLKKKKDELRVVLTMQDDDLPGAPKERYDCGDPPQPDFFDAVHAARPLVVRALNLMPAVCAANAPITRDVLERENFDADKIIIQTIAFTEMGVVFSGVWFPQHDLGPADFTTPELWATNRERPNTAAGWDTDLRLIHLDNLIDVVDTIRKEAEAYLSGKRAQGALFPDDAPNLKRELAALAAQGVTVTTKQAYKA